MDRLDQLLDTTAPMLCRIDEVLSTAGAPGGHAIWSELRRVRLLPGDAARAVAALQPAAVIDAVPELRADARLYAALADGLPAAGGWTGDAADAYEQARRKTAEHLNGGPDSLGHRMEATADLADALADWMLRTRAELAHALAEAVLSTEALTLTGGDAPLDEQAAAAATIGCTLLRTVADSYDRADELLDRCTTLQLPAPT